MLLTPVFQVVRLVVDDVSTQAESPVAAPDLPDSTIGTSERYSVSPSADEHAYIQRPASSNVMATPLTLPENGLASGATVLESPTNTRHDGAITQSELETKFVYGFDTTAPTVSEPPSRLPHYGVFSDVSYARCPSSPPAPNDSCSNVSRTPPPGQTDLVAPCADDSSNGLQNSVPLEESLSVTFVRPASPLPPSSPGPINDSIECSSSTFIPPSSPISSPAPTSSPPNLFTSSPSRHAIYKSPPTSPGPVKNTTAAPPTIYSRSLKRPRSPETVITPADDQGEDSEEQTVKKKVRYAQDQNSPCSHYL